MPGPESDENAFMQAAGRQTFTDPPRVLIIGAGSRGAAYAKATLSSTNSAIVAVCEPNDYKRAAFGRRFIWGDAEEVKDYQAFRDWKDWKEYEVKRREQEKAGHQVEKGIDAVFVCVLDEMHEEVVCGIADLGVHISCEKPMSTRLDSCMRMYKALKAPDGGSKAKETIFGICHVLRYSPYNMFLRQLVLEKDVIGDVLSIEHVEPVGWWHFSHSYVRYELKLHSRKFSSLTKAEVIGGKSPGLPHPFSQSLATISTSLCGCCVHLVRTPRAKHLIYLHTSLLLGLAHSSAKSASRKPQAQLRTVYPAHTSQNVTTVRRSSTSRDF
jgi:hypothetical protein